MIDLDKSYVNRLLYFYFVASCKNITHAAREAGLHQSAMSRQMLKLEKEIGIPLIKRHKSGITLTSKGEELFQSAESIYNEIQITRKKLNETEEISGKIRICTTYAIVNYIIGDYLMEFQLKYPKIYLDIVCDDYVIDLVKNDVDIVIRPYDFEKTDSIIQEPLIKLQGKLYASNAYIDKNGYPETLEDLNKHKFIVYSRAELLPFEVKVDWFLKIEGCTSKKNSVMETNSVEMIYKAAINGKGIISAYDNMDILKKAGLINVAPQVKGPEYLFYLSHHIKVKNLSRIQILKEFLKEKLF